MRAGPSLLERTQRLPRTTQLNFSDELSKSIAYARLLAAASQKPLMVPRKGLTLYCAIACTNHRYDDKVGVVTLGLYPCSVKLLSIIPP